MEERKDNQEIKHNQEFEEEKKDSHEIEEEENTEKIEDIGTVEDRLNKKRMLIISAIATAIALFIIFSFFSNVLFGLFHHQEILKPKGTTQTLAPKMEQDWKTMTDMKINQLQNQLNNLEKTNQQLLQTIQQQQKQQQQHQQNLQKLISPPPEPPPPPPARMPRSTSMPRYTPPPPPPPPMNYNNNNQGPMIPKPEPKPTLKVFKAKQTAFKEAQGAKGTKGAKGVSATEKQVSKTEKIKLPIGFLRGLTLTGLDAPTFQYGQNNPEPILIVSLSRQILADNRRLNLKGCFFLGSGYGEISSERAYIRLVKISCIDNKGHIIQQKVHGWIFDADGKVGLRGRVVSKQGAVLAKTFMAGLLQGISSIISSSATTTQISPIGTTQTISPSEVSKVAVASGFQSAASQLAQFYMKIAEQMYPVVEIAAGRRVSILIDGGSLEKDDKVKLVSNPLE